MQRFDGSHEINGAVGNHRLVHSVTEYLLQFCAVNLEVCWKT